MTIVEIGGGLSGLQFVLASEGHAVTNIDPGGASESEWGFQAAEHRYLANVFRAPVQLITRPIEQAGLEDRSADRVLCVSVIEHLSPTAAIDCMKAVGRVLRPDGFLVLTVDLFLDLAPFTNAESGRWGRNANVRELLDAAGLTLVKGEREELFGYDEFSMARIRHRTSDYLVSTARSLAQCLVAKPRFAG